MPEKLSELQAQDYLSNLRLRKAQLEQIQLKRHIEQELTEDPLPLREQQLREALKVLTDNRQRVRVSGLL